MNAVVIFFVLLLGVGIYDNPDTTPVKVEEVQKVEQEVVKPKPPTWTPPTGVSKGIVENDKSRTVHGGWGFCLTYPEHEMCDDK